MDKDNIMRLQKFIALCGIASRRKAEDMIKTGRVMVNNNIITTLGEKIDVEKDIVAVDSNVISIEKNKIYIILNKPIGYISSSSDQFNRATVIDLIKNDIKERVYPVGRLDYDTEGLLLLTNDGEFAYKLTHPKHIVNKTYIAIVKGIPNKEKLQQFRRGLNIEDYTTSPAKIEIIKRYKENSTLKITIHEGKNRQVRKMCDKIGHPVIKLKRISIGTLQLKDLQVGKWRYLESDEINCLKEL